MIHWSIAFILFLLLEIWWAPGLEMYAFGKVMECTNLNPTSQGVCTYSYWTLKEILLQATITYSHSIFPIYLSQNKLDSE